MPLPRNPSKLTTRPFPDSAFVPIGILAGGAGWLGLACCPGSPADVIFRLPPGNTCRLSGSPPAAPDRFSSEVPLLAQLACRGFLLPLEGVPVFRHRAFTHDGRARR